MGPGHGDAGALAGVQDHADQPLGRDDRIERGDALAASRRSAAGCGRRWAPAGAAPRPRRTGVREPAAQREQLAEPLILGDERRQALGEVGGGVALGRDRAESGPAGPALFGAELEPDERGRSTVSRSAVGDAETPSRGERADATTDSATQTAKRTVSRRAGRRSDALAMVRSTGRCGTSRSRRGCGRCRAPRR